MPPSLHPFTGRKRAAAGASPLRPTNERLEMRNQLRNLIAGMALLALFLVPNARGDEDVDVFKRRI
jgi:hypothetical protein